METKRRLTAMLAPVLALALALGTATPAAAHCDSLDGPVVAAARKALEAGDVNLVLVWVREQDEAEIRAAFEKTLKVRELSAEARELADHYFFETLVRVHRAGEGAPYTGLKPAGYEPPAGIVAADRAVDAGSLEDLDEKLAEHAVAALRDRFERVQALKGYDRTDVEAGRAYVHAYVEFIHFVENLHALIHEEVGAAGHETH